MAKEVNLWDIFRDATSLDPHRRILEGEPADLGTGMYIYIPTAIHHWIGILSIYNHAMQPKQHLTNPHNHSLTITPSCHAQQHSPHTHTALRPTQ